MSRPRLRIAAVAAVLALLALPSTSAWAEDAKTVAVTGQNGRIVQMAVFLDPSVGATAQSEVTSTVIISGTEIPSTASPVIDTTRAREAILVLDISGSMRGERLAAAKQGAIDYVNALPAAVEIGLVTFNDDVEVVVPPTTDRGALRDAIEGLRAGQKTALFDGVLTGLDEADVDRGARLFVLSDGGDTASAATLEDVQATADAAGVPVDVVALTPNTSHADTLRDLAERSGGQFFLAADVGGLRQAFDQATGSFGGKIAVTATVPDDVDASGKVAVVNTTVDGVEYRGTTSMPRTTELQAVGTAATVVAPETTTPSGSVVDLPSSRTFPWLYAALAMLIVIIFILTIVYYRAQQKAYMRTQQVLWYSNSVTSAGGPIEKPDFRQSGLVKSLDKRLERRSNYARKQAALDNAQLNLSPAAWLIIRLGITFFLVFVLAVVLGSLPFGLIIGGLVGWFGTRAFVNSRETKVRKKFETELPDFLLLIASALRSGLSFQQALDSTAAEGQGVVSRQVRRALSEVQMGSSVEDALMRVADRMDSTDMRWTVTALAIQREVGGNLSNILDSAAQTVKGRAELRREVRTLSAEGRLSGWVLAALPVGLFLYMLVANRDYISFFWTRTAGYILLGVIFVVFILGFMWMRRIVKIEV